DGKDCPSAVSWAPKPKPIAAAPVRNVRRFMVRPRLFDLFAQRRSGRTNAETKASAGFPERIILRWHHPITVWNEIEGMPWNDRVKRRLKLRDLDILGALIETGSMGKAASRLGV